MTSKGPEQKSARPGSGPSTLVIALVALLVVALVGCAWLVKVNRDKDADVKAGQDRAKIVEEPAGGEEGRPGRGHRGQGLRDEGDDVLLPAGPARLRLGQGAC
ncbi:hypothetical protein [Nocardioides convexus]|uniref:hypothetical protein n=1 Tax=Nocardioides convexus TaxID=2712224 RepID=UPI002418915A|nr:hypothetical protein [Nocardioides convexus]